MAPKESIKVIDLADSSDEDDDSSAPAPRANPTHSWQVHKSTNGNGNVTGSPNAGRINSIPTQSRNRLAAPVVHSSQDSLDTRSKHIKPLDTLPGRAALSSDSSDGEGLLPPKRLDTQKQSPLGSQTHDTIDQQDVIEIEDDEREETPAKLPRKQQDSIKATSSNSSGQHMPSSNVGFKRPREENQSSLDSIQAKKQRKPDLRRNYGPPSPAVGGRSLEPENEEGLPSSKLSSPRTALNHRNFLMIDLTVDDDQDVPVPAQGTKQFTNSAVSNTNRAGAAKVGPSGSSLETTRTSHSKSIIPPPKAKVQGTPRRKSTIQSRPAASNSDISERDSEIPESLPGTPTGSEDEATNADLSASGLTSSKKMVATKSKSSPAPARASPSKMVSASFPEPSVTSLENRPLESFRKRQSEELSRSQTQGQQTRGERSGVNRTSEGLSGTDVIESSEHISQNSLRPGSASSLHKSPTKLTRQRAQEAGESATRSYPISPSDTSIEDNHQPSGKISTTSTIDGPKGRTNFSYVEKSGSPTRALFTGDEVSRPSGQPQGLLETNENLAKSRPQTVQAKNIERDSPNSTSHQQKQRIKSSDKDPGLGAQQRTGSAVGREVEGESHTESELNLRLPSLEQAAKIVRSEDESAFAKTSGKARSERGKVKQANAISSVQDQGSLKHVVLSVADRDVTTPDSTSFQQQSLSLHADLSAAKRTEHVVGQYLEELQSDNEHWIRTWLKRARFGVQQRQPAVPEENPTDVFSKMKPLLLDDRPRKLLPDHARLSSESHALTHRSQKKSYTVPCTIYKTHDEDVPNYSHYVSISNNFLAHNETTLQHWPYFGDEFDTREAEGLDQQYYLDVLDRWEKLHRLSRAEHFAPYAADMLKDMGCQWSDVLRFLLDPSPDVGIDEGARSVAFIRDSFCQEDFSRAQQPWTRVLSKLPDPEPDRIGKAALLCERFQSLTKLSFWHIVRRSEYTTELLKEVSKNLTMDELTCRVCMRFNCQYHGEINEHHESDEDDDGIAGTHVVETDIIHPPIVNYRSRVGFPPSIDTQESETTGKDRRALKYWHTGQNAHLLVRPDERGPFYPCHHPGQSCNSAKCSCFENKIPCEKTCSCPQSCSRKFQGCNCSTLPKRKGRKRVCFEEEHCACFQLGRECDADLCGDCGVCEVLDPVNRNDDRVLDHRCSNASIQRGIPKHTILGDSAVHGLGLYACEAVREHDFLGEYKGEIIMKDEAERRGAVYEHQKLSYLFSLNKRQEIDSTHFGNKLRFINHAYKNKCNLYPRIIMVNTVHRIALYAQRNIRAGEELFFDYGPMFPGDQLGGKTGRKTEQGQSKAAPHVRNSLLVKGFHDVEHDEDELGNRRAVKVTRGQGRPRPERPAEDASKRRGRLKKTLSREADPTEIDRDDARAYGHLSQYNIVQDDTGVGPLEERDPGVDDEDFEPEDSASMISEVPEGIESESECDSEELPIQPIRKQGGSPKYGSIRERLEQLSRGR